MTMRPFLQKGFTVAIGTISTLAIAGGIVDQAAQAALFTSTVTVSGTDPLGTFVPFATSTFSYNKVELSPQRFGYTLLSLDASITAPFITRNYTLADLPTYATEIQTLAALIPSPYQGYVAKYQEALTNVINRTSGLSSAPYDYVGDGDFPPPNATLTFKQQDLPPFSMVQLLFPQGGRVAFSSISGISTAANPLELTPQSLAALLETQFLSSVQERPTPVAILPTAGQEISASLATSTTSSATAVPEPTTMLGAGLAAGAAAIARRQKKKAA